MRTAIVVRVTQEYSGAPLIVTSEMSFDHHRVSSSKRRLDPGEITTLDSQTEGVVRRACLAALENATRQGTLF